MTGPEDCFDDETNGDPDSTVGEEDESGFDEMSDYPDEPLDDDGFDDAEADEDDEDAGDDEDEDEDDED